MLDFLGIGARRAGEDWLFNRLRTHPEIHFPRSLEIGFWSKHYPQSLQDETYARNLNWYRSLFGQWETAENTTASPAQASTFKPPKRSWFDALMLKLDQWHKTETQKMTPHSRPEEGWEQYRNHKMGDFSPSYCQIEDTSILQSIHAFAPDLRILYIIRNPVDRAWAAAERLRMMAGLAQEEVSDAWYMDHFQSTQSLTQGDYAANLSRWQSVFPNSTFLVVQYEELCAAPKAVLKRCCEHLGLQNTAYFDSQITGISSLPQMAEEFPIRPALAKKLQVLYREKNDKLTHEFGINYPSAKGRVA